MKKKFSLLGKVLLLCLFLAGEAKADLVTGPEFYLRQGGVYLFFLGIPVLIIVLFSFWGIKKIKKEGNIPSKKAEK